MYTDYSTLQFHPLTSAFPLIDGDDFERFVESVKRCGLVTRIIIHQETGMIIDGRIRYLALREAGIAPNESHFMVRSIPEEKLESWIYSVNMIRTHLTRNELDKRLSRTGGA